MRRIDLFAAPAASAVNRPSPVVHGSDAAVPAALWLLVAALFAQPRRKHQVRAPSA